MYQELLDLPARISKPRTNGLTMVIDSGMPSCYFEDAITSAAEHVDIVKFGWGTSLVTHDLPRKLDVLQKLGIRYYFGGTLFEKFVLQDRFESFLSLCRRCGTDLIEVSNGTIPLDNTAKAAYIRKCTDEFTVVSEVGFKDAGRSQRLAPSQWIDYIAEDIEAGASLVICEARETGRSGICRQDGELRWGLI